VPYVALLLRTNFRMDAEDRGCWLNRNEPTRADSLLLRLPMTHREGWTGKRSSSNTPFSWAVWQEGQISAAFTGSSWGVSKSRSRQQAS